MKQILKLGIVLALYATVSCFMLALVNAKTAPAIELAKKQKQDIAMKEVFKQADDFANIDLAQYVDTTSKIKVDTASYAKTAGEIVGVVIQVTGATYDKSTIIVGITKDGIVSGMKVMETTDSPGFGQNAMKPEFYEQFAGVDSKSGFVAGTTFVAISGATITSNGMADLLNCASSTAMRMLSSGNGGL